MAKKSDLDTIMDCNTISRNVKWCRKYKFHLTFKL